MADFKHFSVVAGGDTVEGHQVPDGVVGPSVMSAKIWADSVEQAVDVYCEVGNHLGFRIEQNVEVHRTPAKQAKREQPFAYEVRVIPCAEHNRSESVQVEVENLRNE